MSIPRPHLLLALAFVCAAPRPSWSASVCRGAAIHHAEFEPAEQLRDSLPELSASTQLIFNNDQRCSGAYVSDDGVILTASHCLDHCPGDTCDVKINGRATKVRIQFRARCSLAREEREMIARTNKPACIGMSDVAVIKVDQLPAGNACLPMAREYREGDAVHTMGYPRATNRGRGDSSGTGLFLSYGKVVAPNSTCLIKQNASWGDWWHGVGRPGERASLVPFGGREGFYAHGKIQTTVDAVKGNSGGPLINTAGEVVAVASVAHPLNYENQECAGATFFAPLRLADPGREIADPGFEFEKIRCEKRRATPKERSL